MSASKRANASRLEPRYRINVGAERLLTHWRTIADFALNAATEEPFDIVVEMIPGTGKITGKLLFIHPGHSTMMAEFIKTLKTES